MYILNYIAAIPDPRQDYKVEYPLSTLLFTTLCAVLCGCQSWQEVSDYCEAKKEWLSKYVDLSMGIPSLWTFRRLFSLIEPQHMENFLLETARFLLGRSKSDQITIDGKFLKGSGRHNKECLKSISAWCYENGLVLAEKMADNNSHESKSVPLLLDSLVLKNMTVSLDAAGCQPAIAEKILNKKGQYVLALKKNQPKLYESVVEHIEDKGRNAAHLLKDYFDEKHGRSVRRRYFGYDISKSSFIEKWPGLKTAIAVETISSKSYTKTVAEWRYYLSSHPVKNPHLPEYVLNHWNIENKLHWVLDVQMNEDNDLKSERRSAKAFATLRRIALNIVRTKDKTKKRSVRCKMLWAAWREDSLLKLLT